MSARQSGHDIAIVLGIDPSKVLADSMHLEPFGSGWRVSWEGCAFLDGEAARILFGPTVRTNRSETFAERMARQSVEAMEAQKAADRTIRHEEEADA